MRNTPDTSLQHFLSETRHGLGDTVKDALGPSQVSMQLKYHAPVQHRKKT